MASFSLGHGGAGERGGRARVAGCGVWAWGCGRPAAFGVVWCGCLAASLFLRALLEILWSTWDCVLKVLSRTYTGGTQSMSWRGNSSGRWRRCSHRAATQPRPKPQLLFCCFFKLAAGPGTRSTRCGRRNRHRLDGEDGLVHIPTRRVSGGTCKQQTHQ